MAYLEYGCSALPNHELVLCGAYNRGGISAIGILEEDALGTGATFATAADWSNGAKYTTAITRIRDKGKSTRTIIITKEPKFS